MKVESLSSRNTLDPNDSVDLDKSGVVVRVYLEDARNIQYKSIKVNRFYGVLVKFMDMFPTLETYPLLTIETLEQGVKYVQSYQ